MNTKTPIKKDWSDIDTISLRTISKKLYHIQYTLFIDCFTAYQNKGRKPSNKICPYFDENFDKTHNKNDTFPRAHFFARRARGIQRG